MLLTFRAYTDTEMGEQALRRPFEQALLQATIFPEKVQLFKEVFTGQVTVVKSGQFTGEGAEGIGRLRGEEEMIETGEGLGPPTVLEQRDMFSVMVRCQIFPEQELRTKRAQTEQTAAGGAANRPSG